MPKISVLMPVYNTCESYLREAIESILAQSFTDYEFLILDDASPDKNVEKIIKSYKDKRISYHRNPENMGISASRNKLLGMAKGEYLAIFDHDDISFPERLQKQAEYLDKHPDTGVVGNWHLTLEKKKTKIKKLPVTDSEIRRELLLNCCMPHSSSMLRKSVLVDNGIHYEDEYTPAEDYALWCRLISKTKFANIPEILFSYRNYGGNTSNSQKSKMQDADIRIKEFARKENPELWAAVKASLTKIKKISLFGGIPFLTIKEKANETKWLLFGFIPVANAKTKIKR